MSNKSEEKKELVSEPLAELLNDNSVIEVDYITHVVNPLSISTLLCGASKGFMKASQAFVKPSEASKRSVEIKI